jgi:hypothetical protein
MMEILSWIVSNWPLLIVDALAVIGGASAILKVISKLTKTTKDDEAVVWLGKVMTWLSGIALHPPTVAKK